MKVFVASNYVEFARDRAAVVEGIRELGYQPLNMEDFGASSTAPIEICVSTVKNADCVIILLANRYGSLVPGQQKSFTHLEIETALALELPILLYQRDDSDQLKDWPPAFQTLIDDILSSRTAARYTQIETLLNFIFFDLPKLGPTSTADSFDVLREAGKMITQGAYADARRVLFQAVSRGTLRAYRRLALVEILSSPADTGLSDATVMLSRAAASGDQPSAAALKALVACCPAWLDVPPK